jgi:proteasome-associated ATPase
VSIQDSGNDNELDTLRRDLRHATDELEQYRRRSDDYPSRVEALEEQLLEAHGQVTQLRSNNEKLTVTIQQTREQIAALRDEVEKLTQPPAVYGTSLPSTPTERATSSLRAARCACPCTPTSIPP